MSTIHHSTTTIWSIVQGFGKDALFTGPDLKKKIPSIDYKTMYNRLVYLSKIGVIEKTNTWTGDNYITYRVLNTDKKPRSLDLSSYYSRSKKNKNPGSGLFAAVTKNQHKSVNIVEAIDRMSDHLVKLLEIAKEHPQATIQNFATPELFKELERRTAPPA